MPLDRGAEIGLRDEPGPRKMPRLRDDEPKAPRRLGRDIAESGRISAGSPPSRYAIPSAHGGEASPSHVRGLAQECDAASAEAGVAAGTENLGVAMLADSASDGIRWPAPEIGWNKFMRMHPVISGC